MILLAAVLSGSACSPKAPPNGGSSGGGTPVDPFSQLVLTSKPVNVGKMEVLDPEPATLLELPGLGSAPPDHVWIWLNDGFGRAEAESAATALGGTVVGEVAFLGAYQLRTTTTSIADLLSLLERAAKLPQVQLALPNLLLRTELTAATGEMVSPVVNANYQDEAARPYEMIGLREAWAMVRVAGIALNPVTVGVLDRVVWGDSLELNQTGGPQLRGLALTDLEGRPEQGDLAAISHGTKVAHVIAANHLVGRSIGVASVLGDKLTVVARDVFDATPDWQPVAAAPTPGDEVAIAEIAGFTYLIKDFVCILEQVEAGATVINCSFGPVPPPADATPEVLALQRDTYAAYTRFLERLNAAHPNVLIVASAGNHNAPITETTRRFGQPLGNVITVGALAANGTRAWFSNYMPARGNLEIALSAPGVGIVTAVYRDGIASVADGTSFSTPMVAAAAAILRSLKPDLTAAQIKAILVETAAARVPSPDGKTSTAVPANVGGRILRVDNAVLRVVNLVRQSRGLDQLSREQLLGLHDITVTAAGGPATFTVTAAVDNVGSPDELTLSAAGMGVTITGNARAEIPGTREIAWQVQKPPTHQGPIELRVTRKPVGSEAVLVIPDAGALGKLQQTVKLFLTLDGDETTTGWRQLSFAVEEGRPNTRMVIEQYESDIAWDGGAFTATSYLKYSSGQAYTASIKGQVSDDGAVVQWVEANYKYEWGTNTELLFEARFEGIPLAEGNNRYWTSGAEAGKYLKRFRSVIYSGPDGKRVAKEYTTPRLTTINLDFRR